MAMMRGLEYRVNGSVVRRVPFPEDHGEKGVLSAMIEWLRLREHEICWLVDLPTPFMQLFPGDEVEITILGSLFEPMTIEDVNGAGHRSRENKRSEAALDVWINGLPVYHVQHSRGVTADVTWIEPTEEMIARDVRPSLRAALATTPEDIRYFALAEGDRICILLSEAPVAAADAESGQRDDTNRGAAWRGGA